MMTMRLHDERWCKRGGSQRLCGHVKHPWAFKPSNTVKACVLSNHVKFWPIHAQVEGISMLVPFTAQRVMSLDHGIGDGLVGRRSMTFVENLDKDSIDGMVNDENETAWWTLMQTWMISKIMWEWHASLSLETLWDREGMCLVWPCQISTHTCTAWRSFNVGPIHCSQCRVDGCH